MKRPGAPLFLQRGPYRRRRRIDAARLLPVFGAFLLLLPMLWEPENGHQRRTAWDGVYLFAVWGAMILCARLLAPGLSAPEPAAAWRPGPEGNGAGDAAGSARLAPEPGGVAPAPADPGVDKDNATAPRRETDRTAGQAHTGDGAGG